MNIYTTILLIGFVVAVIVGIWAKWREKTKPFEKTSAKKLFLSIVLITLLGVGTILIFALMFFFTLVRRLE